MQRTVCQSYNEIGAGSREGAGDSRGCGAAIMVQLEISHQKERRFSNPLADRNVRAPLQRFGLGELAAPFDVAQGDLDAKGTKRIGTGRGGF